jgi:hypothetical protein
VHGPSGWISVHGAPSSPAASALLPARIRTSSRRSSTRQAGGYGADAVILTVAGDAAKPLELAASVARDRAIVVAVGDLPLSIPRRPFYDKELQLRLSRSYGPGRYDPDYEEHGRDYPIGQVRWTERRLVN